MSRPDHLPDFTDPPLEEVVLGVQFTAPRGYTSVHSADVWNLFKGEFPNVEEHPPLEPQFETFGGSNTQAIIQFKVGPPPMRGKLWFISEERDHLVQFQDDRILLNWRKTADGPVYPRFESIEKAFCDYFERLERYFKDKLSHQIKINQAEVTYINIIPVENYNELEKWISLWGRSPVEIESLTSNLTEVVKNDKATAFARMHYGLQSVATPDGKDKAFRLSLTFRGNPSGQDKEASLKFIEEGRDRIVTRFDEITTERAHKSWGKRQ